MEELWEKSEKYNPRGWRVARGRSLVTRFYTDTVTLKATLFLLSPLFSTLRGGGLKSFVKLDESVFSLREQSIITFFFFFHDFFPPGKHTRTKGYHFIWLLFLFSALVDFQLGRLRLLSIWQSEQPEQSVPDEWLQVSHGCVNKAKERNSTTRVVIIIASKPSRERRQPTRRRSSPPLLCALPQRWRKCQWFFKRFLWVCVCVYVAPE